MRQSSGLHAHVLVLAEGAVGKVYELDKGHLYWSGEFNSTIFNDAGSGFAHGTSWVCPGYNELCDGVSLGSAGRCVGTDMDGDKIFNTWQGDHGTVPLKFNGTYEFVGGTGKYAGIRGQGTFRANAVPTTEQVQSPQWRVAAALIM